MRDETREAKRAANGPGFCIGSRLVDSDAVKEKSTQHIGQFTQLAQATSKGWPPSNC